MHDSPHPTETIGEVAIHLLDPASGRPVKSWVFTGQSRITMGRAPDQDVAMSDPYVSRFHAELVHRDGRWSLISHGRNGVVVANQLVVEHPVGNDLHFRLGVEGPMLKFCGTSDESDEVEVMATISFHSEPEPTFQLDETRLQQEVGEIAEGEYFQKLQQRAKQMRHHRDTKS